MVRTALVLVGLMVVWTIATPVGAHSTTPEPIFTDDAVDITYNVRVDSEAETLEVRAVVAVPSRIDWITFDPPAGAEVVRTQGFEVDDDRYVKDNNQDTGTITYRIGHGSLTAQPNMSFGDGWAVFRHDGIRGATTWSTVPGEIEEYERFRSAGLTQRFPGHSFSLIGEYGIIDSADPGKHYFRLVVPSGVSLAADGDEVLSSLAYARANLDVGHRHTLVSGFVVGETDTRPGFTARGVPEFVISASERPDGPDNRWFRKYVHTRLNFSTTSRLGWLYDASAEYQAARLSLERGTMTWAEFQETATVEQYADENLRRPGVALEHQVYAEKGAAVVAAIDERIRRATEGEYTFEAVLRRMNRRPGAIDPGEFRAIVAGITGESMDDEIDDMVMSRFEPAPPDDPYVFAAGPAADHDGDGLTTVEEREAGTNPFAADSDGDGVDDRTELQQGTDPTAGDGPPADSGDPETDDGSDTEDPTVTTDTPSPTNETATATDQPGATPTDESDTAAGTGQPNDGNPIQTGLVALLAAAMLVGVAVRLRKRR